MFNCPYGSDKRSEGVVEVEVKSRHGETVALNVFHLERDERIDEIVREHAAAGQEFAILVEVFESLFK